MLKIELEIQAFKTILNKLKINQVQVVFLYVDAVKAPQMTRVFYIGRHRDYREPRWVMSSQTMTTSSSTT